MKKLLLAGAALALLILPAQADDCTARYAQSQKAFDAYMALVFDMHQTSTPINMRIKADLRFALDPSKQTFDVSKIRVSVAELNTLINDNVTLIARTKALDAMRHDDEANECPWLDKPAKVHDDDSTEEIKLLEHEIATARIILAHKEAGE